jgi:hypothetical protein
MSWAEFTLRREAAAERQLRLVDAVVLGMADPNSVRIQMLDLEREAGR